MSRQSSKGGAKTEKNVERVADLLKAHIRPLPERPAASPAPRPQEQESGPRTAACPLCNDLGFVVPDLLPGQPGFGRAVPCSCRHQEREQARLRHLSRMSQIGALESLTFDTFLQEGMGLPPDKARNLALAWQRARQFAAQPHEWLLLRGGYGCGKTHLAAAIANEQLAHNRPVLFVNTPDLLDHLRSAYRPNAPETYDERFEQVRTTPLLILDDFGAHSPSEWAQEKLYQIFNYRYNAHLPTVITTNEDLENIEPRIRSRLSDLSRVQVLAIAAPDFRRGGVYQEEIDLSALHLHADKTFDSFELRDYELTRTQVASLKRAVTTLKGYADSPTGWIVITGTSYGNGKTHLAAAVANTLSGRGDNVLFVMVPDLLDYLRASFDPRQGVRLDKRFAQIKNVPLLILDDLGTESATPWAREKLYQLFNYRYSALLPTIITTAVSVDALEPRLKAYMENESRCTSVAVEAPGYYGGSAARRRPNGRTTR
jgi:DNA replication protein DnaC